MTNSGYTNLNLWGRGLRGQHQRTGERHSINQHPKWGVARSAVHDCETSPPSRPPFGVLYFKQVATRRTSQVACGVALTKAAKVAAEHNPAQCSDLPQGKVG